MLERLMRVISIYQEHQAKFHTIDALKIPVGVTPPPLPPRKSPVNLIPQKKTSSDSKNVSEWVSAVQDESGVATPRKSSPTSSFSNQLRPTISQKNASFFIPEELGFHRLSVSMLNNLSYPSAPDILSPASPHPPRLVEDQASIGFGTDKNSVMEMESLNGIYSDSNSVSNVQVSTNESEDYGEPSSIDFKDEEESPALMNLVIEAQKPDEIPIIDKVLHNSTPDKISDLMEQEIAPVLITDPILSKEKLQVDSSPSPEAQNQEQAPAL
jgi:hypothetical protein